MSNVIAKGISSTLKTTEKEAIRANIDLVPTTSTTDTTAGRLLKVGDFGVGSMIVSTQTAANAAPYLSTGSYLTPTSVNMTDVPTGLGYRLYMQVEGNTSYVKQTVTHNSASNVRMFYREGSYAAILAGGVPWVEVLHRNSILGTVSQSSGVPTGSIIERGSSANGEFVKFADGTMICTRKDLLLTYANSVRLTTNFVPAATFVATPTTSVSFSSSATTEALGFATKSNGALVITVFSNGIGDVRLYQGSTTFSAGDSTKVDYVLIGRWY